MDENNLFQVENMAISNGMTTGQIYNYHIALNHEVDIFISTNNDLNIMLFGIF